jgi:hypothetical protein
MFLAPGSYLNSSSKTIRVGLGPSSDQLLYFSCDPAEMDADQYYAIHQSCLDLLRLHIASDGSDFDDPDGLDTAALHFALYALRNDLAGVGPHPGLMYAVGCQTDFWLSIPGFEMLVANPALPDPNSDPNSNPVTVYLRSLISGGESTLPTRNYIPPQTAAILPAKVKLDPFCRLPLELLFNLSEYLDDLSLLQWCTASWTVHSALRVNNRFWHRRITNISMPWLKEIVHLLDDEELMSGVDVKGLLCWLDGLTAPAPGLPKPLIGVANRRRIWAICEFIELMHYVVMNTQISEGTEEDLEGDSDEDVSKEESSGKMENSKADLED